MTAVLARADEVIKGLGRPLLAARAGETARTLLLAILIAGPIYGAFMGSFALSPARSPLIFYAAVKVPILILGTTLVCLPGFFVMNTVVGLRGDFRVALRAILASQAALTIALASLGPFTRFIYLSGASHRGALLFNAAMFTIATATAQIVLLRRYRPLIARDPRHRIMLWMWVMLYAFVGIQLGWMLRPFVGNPAIPVAFLRDEPFSNAYVVVLRLIFGS